MWQVAVRKSEIIVQNALLVLTYQFLQTFDAVDRDLNTRSAAFLFARIAPDSDNRRRVRADIPCLMFLALCIARDQFEIEWVVGLDE